MKFLLAALLSSAALPAIAADMPVKAPYVAPVAYDWTGFYLGIHGGYGWTDTKVDDFDLNGGFASALRLNQPKLKGWVFGGHAGYNWQWSSWVGGLELDYSATDLKESQSRSQHLVGPVADPFTEDTTRKLSAKLDALASARARLGFLLTPSFLLYGTAGMAWGHTKADASASDIFRIGTLTETDIINTHSGANHWGWVAGGGGEFAVFGAGSGWRLRAEFLHYDFGRSTMAFSGREAFTIAVPGTTATFINSLSTNIDARLTTNVVRGGLSYKF